MKTVAISLMLLSNLAFAGAGFVVPQNGHPTARNDGADLPIDQIAGYLIEVSLDDTVIAVGTTSSATEAVEFEGLADGVMYQLRAQTIDTIGQHSEWSLYKNLVAEVSDPIPAPPNPPVEFNGIYFNCPQTKICTVIIEDAN